MRRYVVTKTVSLSIALLIGIIFRGFPAYGADLFTWLPMTALDDTPPEQQAQLEKLSGQKTTISVNVIKLDVSALEGNETDLHLSEGKSDRARTKSVEKRDNDHFTWVGELENVPGEATLVVNGDQVTGTIRRSSELFRIRPLGKSLHALIKVDLSKFPEDHPPTFDEDERKIEIDKSDFLEPRSDAPPPFIDVMVAYTSSVSSAVVDIGSFIQLAVDETNLSYKNSNINAKLRLVHQVKVTYSEGDDNFDTILRHLASATDGVMDELHGLRDSKKADIVVLLINKSDYCGKAGAILADLPTAAFAIVYHDCATGYYSFGHEIGHLQGARHNVEKDSATTPFAFGHGYLGQGWRTVMAYDCSSKCPRLPYWSNPEMKYKGAPMGTKEHENNAMVLNKTACSISGFRGVEPACVR